MDSYFKAAVCDLDKLLDEFEQNTDEYDCLRTPQNPCDSKHRSLFSVLGCLQHAFPAPEMPEDADSCPSPEKTPLVSHAGTRGVLCSQSPPQEQSVAGPDLLSTVDSGSLNEMEASSLGRCGIPVCDLVNDTADLIHAHQGSQKSQPADFQCSQGSIGFGLSCIPVPICVSSSGCRDASSTEQSDGDSMLQDSGCLTTEEMNHLALKSDSYTTGEISDSCDDQHRTEPVKCSEVLDQPEQAAHLDIECVLVATQNSNANGPKDEKACEKLLCESQDDSACSAVSKEMRGGNAIGKGDPKDGSNAISMLSDLLKRHQVHKTHATLPGICVAPGFSCQTGAEVQLEKKITEENVCNEELNSSETLRSVSSLRISAEDVQTSPSCLPVSMCGSLVVREEKVNPLPQNAVAEVISGTVAVHSGASKTDPSGRESCENTDWHEQEEYLAEISKSIVENSEDGVQCNAQSVIDGGDSQEIEAFASAFLDLEVEPYDVGVDSFYDESMSPVVADLTVEESVIKSDILVSDGELDDFLYGQSLQSKALKSSDNDSNLIENNADEGNVTDVNNLDFTEVTEELMQAKLEETMSINSNVKVSLSASYLEAAAEDNVSHGQDVTESSSEALASDVPTEGARPKQLLGLSQAAAGQKQLNRTNVLERENQEHGSVTPEVPLSGSSVSVSKNSDPGEGISEAGGNQTSENTESLKTPAALLWKQPLWVPDSEAPNCMNCQVKFTFTKRRHHCRACGKVFCGSCCKRKCKLQYMEKEARVCTGCYNDINKAQAFERMMSPTGLVPSSSVSSEHSAVPPVEEAQMPGSASSPSLSALLPISALKQPGIEGLCPREQRRVWFADGILPNGEVADTTKLSSGAKRLSQDLSPVNPDLPETHTAANPEEDDMLTDVNQKWKEKIDIMTRTEESHPSVPSDNAQQGVSGQSELVPSYESVTLGTEECSPAAEAKKTSCSAVDQAAHDVSVSPSSYRALCGVEKCVRRDISLVPDGDNLPPLLLAVGEKGKDPVVEEHPSHQKITSLLGEGGPTPLTFILNANLLVNVKLITCSSERCWCFSTNGLHGLGQAEIVILLQRLPEEDVFPSEMFKLFLDIYKDAMKGRFVRNMENITFTENFLNNKEHGGFLFVSPTFQKLDDQILPDNPFLCGILIHKLEIPWAKVFPIRLMLRLGAEYGAYPTPVVSYRHRKPLFGEIGHTIMNLLVDLRNYQYTLHTIDNLFVHVEMGRSCIKIPLKKYNEIMKVINSSNEHVISIGASFNTEADSHLVCVQNKHGLYHTQAVSATGHPRKVTGASFVVFNGALKTSSGFLAKSSIVEDGLMVQITRETMESLRQALRDKKDFRITCGKMDTGDVKEYVDICWVENEEKTNKGILSPVDGKSIGGTQSEKAPQGRDFEREGKVMKCTEVCYFVKDNELSSAVPHQFAKEIATACSTALCPHLKTLKSNGMNKIGLRVSIDSDMVEYLAGSGGHLLPQNYLNDLDSALIPVIHGGMSDPTTLPVKMELIFFITEHLF
ncbi:zinc finger FYVE domain-containing protein 16 [Pipra filicauda]|uniref:Zinc finger FYVE domain-containing protein n=1 Tax=Pipra filicauda TaxID=649802 RepID=A0A6J2IEM4_9PASS|nr:zinc finger FYVE domain-containing protein 16 [Pipra filicauda]XP_027598516.1 zinc finger FYVE domain-containing protein 16 [Pipra filicauda]XP_039238042.1 zinc finger FYVE domain-containing protein 16 [Pipra filicauda]XP_039238043.1 zinc finger FYVE domain-containing protein 16 [Pipra filicauda]XP_039238044.1 zinc finger FYVE domain-containing protein 16 [Pipra filicauda]XP_039238046.1 zinc finger FYVE domain-containing protein 16 [Pipra filicauda]